MPTGQAVLLVFWRIETTRTLNLRTHSKFQIPNSEFLSALPLSRRLRDCGFRRLLFLGADRVQTLPERVHQVDDLGRRLGRRGDDFLAGDLRVDEPLQALAVLVLVVG